MLRLRINQDTVGTVHIRHGGTIPFTNVHETMPGWAYLGERERSIIERHTETDRMWALSEYRARHGRECPTAFRFARFLVEIEGNTAGTNRSILGELRHRIRELENRVEELSRTRRQRDINAVLDLRN